MFFWHVWTQFIDIFYVSGDLVRYSKIVYEGLILE